MESFAKLYLVVVSILFSISIFLVTDLADKGMFLIGVTVCVGCYAILSKLDN